MINSNVLHGLPLFFFLLLIFSKIKKILEANGEDPDTASDFLALVCPAYAELLPVRCTCIRVNCTSHL